jgi:hypothetical protein
VHVRYTKNRDRQLVSEEELWGEDLKVEIKSEITKPQDQALKQKIVQKKYCKHKQIANADYDKNLTRQLPQYIGMSNTDKRRRYNEK